MPVLNPSQKQIDFSSGTEPGQRKVQRRQQMTNQKGIPRFDDILTVRMLEKRGPVALPLNTAKSQATRIPIDVQPTVENPTPEHEMVCDRLLDDFFLGNFNRNNESWDHFLKLLLNDIISIDTGPVELVPMAEPMEHPQTGEQVYFAKEMYAVDGSIISKERTEQDTVPEAPDPAYWKYGNTPNITGMRKGHSDDILELIRDTNFMRHSRRGRLKPVPFSRDEMNVIELNPQPREMGPYGFGIIQQAKHWAEILLNQNLSNLKHFTEDELTKGMINIGQEYASQIDDFRQSWKERHKGNTDHSVPIVASDSAEWIPFQPSLKELQYLESQQWYSEMIWYLFGETQSEIGQTEDANVSTSEHDSFQVLQNTTIPRLKSIEQVFNSWLLPKLRDYWIVDGEVEFVFRWDEHPVVQERMREKRRDDLQSSVITVNELREGEGKDPLPWGDAPPEATSAFVREHPEYAMEEWGGVDDVPEPQEPAGGLFGSGPTKPLQDTESDTGGSQDDTGDLGNSKRVDSLKDALERKEPLRNERSGELPNLSSIVDEGTEAIGHVFQDELSNLLDELDSVFPEGEKSSPVEKQKFDPRIDSILDSVDLTDALVGAVTGVVSEAMGEGAETDRQQVESELKERVDDPDLELSIDFDLQDTFAFERMKQKAARDMVTVNSTVKRQIRNTLTNVYEDGGNVSEATQRLQEKIDQLSDSHARLVARTEALDASRHGTQAFQESSDVVGGKKWRASQDDRVRAWHRVMDGKVVEKDDNFTVPQVPESELRDGEVQPSEYPKSAYVVGEDSRYNCRCVQQSVLAEDMPERITQNNIDDVTGYKGLVVEDTLSDRQREIKSEHGEPSKSFETVWKRLRDNSESVTSFVDEIGMSKSTVYKFDDDVGYDS